MSAGPYAHLLGQASVRVGSSTIDFLPNKRFQLLAYLAYQGDWVSRDKLAFLFWPDGSNQTARGNLRQLLKNIRRMDWLEGLESNEHRLRWSVATDVGTFKQALEDSEVEATLSLYRGSLLPGLEGDGEGVFGEWLAMEREAIHERWRGKLLSRVQDLKVSERYELAVQLLSALLERDPLDEEALQAYMGVALKAGHREQALSTYRAFVKRLRSELGMEPTSVTEQLAKEITIAPSILTSVPVLPASETTAPSSPLPQKPLELEVRPVPLPLKPATSFVGRNLELGQIVHLLAQEDCRLLTLTGAGGVGKTRLALQAAQGLGEDYPDGVYFMALDSLRSPSAIPASFAAALGVEMQGQEEPLNQVIRFLWDKHVLIVLDNYEHLLGGATIPSELLQACPKVKVLVTSRERLNFEEEWLLPVEGLGFPAITASVEEASTYDAVQLFVQRVRRMQPGFTLTNEELPHVVKVCRLVDGFPLGLELAAAWARSMSVAEIAHEIEQDYDFLHSTSRNLKDRHRSLRAVFEGSWRLLSKAEQEVLRKLAVFQGGFRKDAAAYVTGASYAVLTALLDKSLLRLAPNRRYDVHPLVHQYLKEKLAEAPEEQQRASEAHAAFYAELLRQWSEGGDVGRHRTLSRKVDEDLENIQMGWRWMIAQERAHALVKYAQGLYHLYDLSGWHKAGPTIVDEYRAVLGHLQSLSPNIASSQVSEAIAYIYEGMGDIQKLHKEHEGARASYSTSLAALPRSAKVRRSRLLRKLGTTLISQYRYQDALDMYGEAEAALGSEPQEDAAWWQEWLEVQLHRTRAHYWLGEWAAIQTLSAKVRPVLEQYGTPLQLSRFHQSLFQMIVLRDHYVPSPEALFHARVAYEAALESGHSVEIAVMQASVGFCHFLRNELGEAEQLIASSLEQAKKTGDRVQCVRCLAYLGLTYRKKHEVLKTRELTLETCREATEARMPEYLGVAEANLAWLAYLEGDLERAVLEAKNALAHWQASAGYRLRWTALFPLIAASYELGKVHEALSVVGDLLSPEQQRLPDEIDMEVRSTVDAISTSDIGLAKVCLKKLIHLAKQAHFL